METVVERVVARGKYRSSVPSFTRFQTGFTVVSLIMFLLHTSRIYERGRRICGGTGIQFRGPST